MYRFFIAIQISIIGFICQMFSVCRRDNVIHLLLILVCLELCIMMADIGGYFIHSYFFDGWVIFNKNKR